jgi:hypothetical protein
MIGHVPDSIGVICHNQAVMKDAMGIGRKVEDWHELAPDLGPYAAMAAAARMNVDLGIHSEEFASACGLPPLRVPSSVSTAE